MTDTLPIVERLRSLVIMDEVRSDNPLGQQAADAIEALVAALEPHASNCVMPFGCFAYRNLGRCERHAARTALEKVRAMK